MICTSKQFDRIMTKIGGKRSRSIFSYKKHEIAYKLSVMKNNRERGHAIEHIVWEMLIRQGKRVRYFGGPHHFDMLVNGSRVEVKSSLANIKTIKGKKYYRYAFQNIKTKNFDKLILVFVSPEGLSVRQMSCAVAKKHLRKAKVYSGGQTLKVEKFIGN